MNIEVGNVVKWSGDSGYMRVKSIRGGKANLGAIFGKGIYHKGVPVNELVECEAEWWAKYTKSESYMCS